MPIKMHRSETVNFNILFSSKVNPFIRQKMIPFLLTLQQKYYSPFLQPCTNKGPTSKNPPLYITSA